MNPWLVSFATFLQVHHSLCVVLQCVVDPSQASVGQSFGHQVVGLRRHTQVLLLEDHGPLVLSQSFEGQPQVSIRPTLAPHASDLLGDIQRPLVPLEQRRRVKI